MPLSGGATDKFGNRFELWWTVRCMAEILAETADAIYLEPPGPTGDGAEFILTRATMQEYHQVKRQHSQLGRWSLAAMEAERVLSRFWTKLVADTKNQCHFVSSFAADELAELSENAQAAADLDQFKSAFLSASQARQTNFAKLQQCWSNCTDQEAYRGLRRVVVRTIDELTLKQEVEYRLTTTVDAQPSHVAGILAQYALAKVHSQLRAHDIWLYLESKGIRRRTWNNDPHVLAVMQAQNARYLEPLRRDAVAGIVIPRSEVVQIVAALEVPAGRQGMMVSGEAGTGKSGVGLQIADAMQRRGWPVLAFRIDQLETMLSPRDVGRQLDLPESPVTVLANIAQTQPCLLIVDQLDAISKASGRNPHFFDCVAELIEQAKLHSHMKVVLLCRKFDIVNDDRLRKLTGERAFAQEMPVGRLDHPTVRDVVTRMGLAALSLTEKQVDLLSIPLHLKLLSEIADTEDARALDFKTANDLFRVFWTHKRQKIAERLGRQIAWLPIINALCDSMNASRRLFAPKELLDEYEADSDAMVSERVLIADGPNFRFFHEAFFDYAFARRFITTGNSLLSLLLSEEQHLFRRAQVRQILAYSREADFNRYLSDLTEVLASLQVRFHVKQVVFALLRQLTSPREAEWEVIAPLLERPDDALHPEAWQLLMQAAWFRLVYSLGVIGQWLAADDEARTDQAVRLIGLAVRDVPEEVAALLESRDTTQEAWRSRLMHVFSYAPLEQSRRLFDLFLTLLRQGVLEGLSAPLVANGDFWLLVYSVADNQPEWYCEVLGAYLNYHLEWNYARGITNPFAPRFTFRESGEADDLQAEAASRRSGTIGETQYDHNFIEVAQKAPEAFVKQVFEFVLLVAERNAVREGAPPFKDSVWPWRSYGEVHGIAETLLQSLEIALGQLAADAPEQFEPYAAQLRASDTETAQYLLVRAYTRNGQRFADEAAAYLCEQPERLHTGWVDEGHWASRLMVEAITPHCSETVLMQLEAVIMGYYTEYERSSRGYRPGSGTPFGYHQLILLNGIAPTRRSSKANRRLAEWRRKFCRDDGDPAEGIRGGFVGSPLSEAVCTHMTDAQWLSAIAEYDTEATRWDRDPLTGGAHQLSQQLEARAKQDPKRFAMLARQFPPKTHLAYFEAVLRGVGEVNEDVDTAVVLCRTCHELPEKPCGRWIARPITKLGTQPIPEEAMAMVAWYALNASDPPADAQESEAGQRRSEMESTGINSVRGSAAMAIADLIFEDSARAGFFIPTIERLTRDPSSAVRACAATALTALLNADRDLAVRLFMQLIENTDDALLATQYVSHFLYYALYTHFAPLRPVLERMLDSGSVGVAEAGAIRSCLIALRLEDASYLAERCIMGTQSQRKGAATVFAQNIVAASNRVLCETALTALFNDEDADVRKAAGSCFQQFKGAVLQDFTKLVAAFVASRGLGDQSFFLLHALEETTAKLPDVTCDVCERFLDATGSKAGDVRTRFAGDAMTVSKLVVRTYEQGRDPQIQSRCLDLVDRLAKGAAHGLLESLALLDR